MSRKHMTYSGIGGQAVIEGIMMKNADKYSVGVRKPDGKIEVAVNDCINTSKRKGIMSVPFVRGVIAFVDSTVLGIKSLTYSASFFEDEEIDEKPSKFDEFVERKLGEKAEGVLMGLVVAISVVFSIALFMMLPLAIADFLKNHVSAVKKTMVPAIEGIVKILIFLIYLLLISLMKDIRRTFMYHGAEHKCINCLESGNELTVENVRKASRYHKRCGTSFLFFVIFISIVFFIFIRTDNILLRYAIRIALIPVIAGISYECIRFAGVRDNLFVTIISAPGKFIQKITTKEPTDDMIEVGIAAVEAVFNWREYLRGNGIYVPDPIDDKYVLDDEDTEYFE